MGRLRKTILNPCHRRGNIQSSLSWRDISIKIIRDFWAIFKWMDGWKMLISDWDITVWVGLAKKFVRLVNTFNKVLGENEIYVFYLYLKLNELFCQCSWPKHFDLGSKGNNTENYRSETVINICPPKYGSRWQLSRYVSPPFLLIKIIIKDKTHYNRGE